MSSERHGFDRAYDVIVAGAGVAGVAAALACARAGLRTALVEKTVLLGGLATAGLINIYLPLCDGHGNQVIYGIAEELLHLSIKYGPGEVPEGWAETGKRYTTPFSPAAFALALDEALVESGVTLWLDTLVCAPLLEGDRIAGIEVENKSGHGVFRARCVIDATGDADVAHRAGAACEEQENWLSLWAIQTSLANAQRAVDNPQRTSLLEVVRVGADANGRGQPADQPKYQGTDGEAVTQFLLEGRRLLRELYATRQPELGERGRHERFLVTLPAMAQFRTTRRAVGMETMTADHLNTELATSVGLIPDWRKPGPTWEIPYGALIPQGVRGLLMAGRCIAAEGEAWEISRVIPPAALTGQLSGIAATLAVQQGTTPDALDVRQVQTAVRAHGLPLHRADTMRTQPTS